MPIDWEQHRPASNGEFRERFKFTNVGDRIAGVLTNVRTITSTYGDTPVITLRHDDSGEEQEVFLSFLDLANGIVDAAPELGDHVAIELGAIDRLPNGNTRKRVSIQVTRAAPGAAEPPSASSLLPAS